MSVDSSVTSCGAGRAAHTDRCRWRCDVPALLVVLLGLCLAMPARSHPMDPLSWEEHWRVLEILRAEGRLDESTKFFRLAVQEPDKAAAWGWEPQSKQALPRQAQVIMRHQGKLIEARVDLSRSRIAEWTERTGVQPPFLTEESESSALIEKVKQDPRFIAGLKRRGIDDAFFVDCGAQPPGTHGEAAYAGRRIAKVFCRPKQRVRNFWARRVEGLTATVDVEKKEILEIVDEDPVPDTATSAEYDEAALGAPRELPTPLRVERPDGPSFRRTGNVFEWDGWRFHLRSDQRVGLVISTASYSQGGERRPVLYEGHLSEIFVPYMDPRHDWYTRTYLDAGEFSSAGLAGTLTEGIDCPAHSAYIDAIVVGANGRPKDKAKVACVFERLASGPSWRHAADGRPLRELVIRNVAVFGNYDYVIDWVLQRNATIRIAVGATGIVEVKMSAQKDAQAPLARGETAGDAYGRYVASHLVGVNHDHFFNFRLDVDIDGAANRFVVNPLQTTELPPTHARRNVWTVGTRLPGSEDEAQLNMDMHQPALWRVASSKRRNAVGYPTSYELVPSMAAHSLLAMDDYPRRRAAFINHDLWVTRYRPEERYAAGDYPTLSAPGEGLPRWSARDSLDDGTDIVLWYTMGMHHVVRAEDWPVMPVLWHDFTLRPFDFFDGNPALNLGRQP